jgi:hypothetical protein
MDIICSVAVMTRAFPDYSGVRKELVLLQNISSYMLMGCGVVYLVSVRQWKAQIFNSGDICVFFYLFLLAGLFGNCTETCPVQICKTDCLHVLMKPIFIVKSNRILN